MKTDFDLVIIGSGFGGALTAMIARRLGYSVALVERGKHPRFAIGESSSPLANLLLEQLAHRYDLPCLLPLTSYGAWKAAYPHLGVGLKRGFTFYHHKADQPFRPCPERSNELLVAASPNDRVADTHWFRADLDQFLVQEACALGVEYLDQTELGRLRWLGEGFRTLGIRQGRAVPLTGTYLVDASGPRGYIEQTLGRKDRTFPRFPATQALYSHFEGVAPFDAGSRTETPPYPPEAAAVHHVFAGGWMWSLRFDNGITSAGIAVEPELAESLQLADGAPAWQRFLARFPSLQAAFAGAKPVQPFVYVPRLPFRASIPFGVFWCSLPSATAFVDPLFSTGIPLTLLGVQRVGAALAQGRLLQDLPTWYWEEEAALTARLVAACYSRFHHFPAFAALSMAYFAVAGHEELEHRFRYTESWERDPGFLRASERRGQSTWEEVFAAAKGRGKPRLEEIGTVLAGYNLAGLCDPLRRNWYGVEYEGLERAAVRVGATPEQAARWVAELRGA